MWDEAVDAVLADEVDVLVEVAVGKFAAFAVSAKVAAATAVAA